MNKEETKRAIEVMQAYVDGEEIQSRTGPGGYWVDTENPAWVFCEREYRIKPKPREFWVGQYPTNGGKWTVYDGEGPPTPIHNEWIKVREVIE